MKRTNSHLIYGRNPIEEALQEGIGFERIYIKDSLHGDLEKYIRQVCRERDIPLKRVPLTKLDQLSRKKAHQGVIGITSLISYQEISAVIPFIFDQGEDPIIVVLDNVQDVRNIGAIARSCEALGANALVLAGKNAGMVNEDSIKTSAGALLRLPVCRARTSINAIQELRTFGVHVYGTSIESGTEVYHTKLQLPGAFVFGSEGQGLHRDIIRECDQLIQIGQKGKSDSLNVSVSVGIVLYELNRQTS